MIRKIKYWLRKQFRCSAGRHVRSKRRARKIDGRVVSVCRYCGIGMYRDGVGVWHEDERQRHPV